MARARIPLILCALMAPSLVLGQTVPHAGAFTIAGSGSNIALTQKLLDAYGEKTGNRIRIPPSIGTTGAVKALKSKALTIGLASRPLKAEEREAGLVELPYARLGIVFGVRSDVPEENLTGEDLVAIYAGTKKTWPNGKMIIVLAREAGDSSNIVLERLVPGFKAALADALSKKRWDVFYTDQDEYEATRNTMNAFGLIDTAAILDLSPSVKALRFNGVEPSLENVASGTYPFWKDLSFFYHEPLPPGAREFLDFVFSAEGASVLRKGGAILPPKAASR